VRQRRELVRLRRLEDQRAGVVVTAEPASGPDTHGI
jgi:hypothetical protein